MVSLQESPSSGWEGGVSQVSRPGFQVCPCGDDVSSTWCLRCLSDVVSYAWWGEARCFGEDA